MAAKKKAAGAAPRAKQVKGTTAKKPAFTPAERQAQQYMHSGSYNITDGKLRKVRGAFANKLLGDTFTAAAGYTQEYADMAKANPGMVAKVDLGFGTYDPATMKARITGGHAVSPKTKKKPGNVAGEGVRPTGGYADELPVASSAMYAEGDVSRTGTAAAQGKAYQYAFGTDAGTVLGATSVPSVAQTEEAGSAEGGAGKPKNKKRPAKKKPGKRPTAAQRKKRASSK